MQRRGKYRILGLAAVALPLAIAGSKVSGAVISLNFGADGSRTPGDKIGSAVVGAVQVGNWNDYMSNPVSASANSVIDSNGATATNFSFAFSSGGVNTFNLNTSNADQRLFSGFMSGTNIVTLSNIPYSKYDIYVYYNGFTSNGSNTYVAQDGSNNTLDTEYSARGSNNSAVVVGTNKNYVDGQYASAAAAQTAAGGTSGANYFIFPGLSATAVKITESGTGGTGISGIQIVDTSATPEPGSLGLLGLSGLGLLRRRRPH